MTDFPWLASYPAAISWRMPVEEKPAYAILDESVARYGNHACLDFLGKVYSYQQVGELVDRAAKGLQALGVGKGTRVGLFLPNCPYFVISYFAILKTGATVVNYNPLYSARELEHQIKDSGTEMLITLNLKLFCNKIAKLLESTDLKKVIVASMQDALPFPKDILFPLIKFRDMQCLPADARYMTYKTLLENDGRYTPAIIHPSNDLALLQYTGGTTGTPKGAMLTHMNVYSNAVQCGAWFQGLREGEEKMVGVLPFFHVFAMTAIMNLGILKGLEIILYPKFNALEMLEDITRKKPTLMPGVPTLFTALYNVANVKKYDLSSLRMCISGGAPLPAEVKERFEKLTGCKLVEGYGLTEASPVAAANPLFGKNKTGSIGLPLPQTRIHVESLEQRGTFLGIGAIGEICIEGPQVMKGYWQREAESAQIFCDGKLRTGDVGYIDEEGYVFIKDRLKEVIIAGGYNIYPRHVEEAIYLHPAVKEAAVIGVADDYRGQAVKAFVALREGYTLTQEELCEFLKEKLAKFELPTHIEFRAELPKTLVGKINKKELR